MLSYYIALACFSIALITSLFNRDGEMLIFGSIGVVNFIQYKLLKKKKRALNENIANTK